MKKSLILACLTLSSACKTSSNPNQAATVNAVAASETRDIRVIFGSVITLSDGIPHILATVSWRGHQELGVYSLDGDKVFYKKGMSDFSPSRNVPLGTQFLDLGVLEAILNAFNASPHLRSHPGIPALLEAAIAALPRYAAEAAQQKPASVPARTPFQNPAVRSPAPSGTTPAATGSSVEPPVPVISEAQKRADAVNKAIADATAQIQSDATQGKITTERKVEKLNYLQTLKTWRMQEILTEEDFAAQIKALIEEP